MDKNGDIAMEALLEWASSNGISDSPTPQPRTSSSSCLNHSLSISIFPPQAGGRGLAAARDIKKGELVLRVPRAALLTTESVLAADEKLAGCLKKHHPHLSPTQILAVCLLAEVGKGRVSRWYSYLIHLPRCYDTLPNFLQFEIEALQVEDAIWVAENAVQRAELDWKKAVVLLQEMELRSQLQTFRTWLWASATISSRTLHIPWDAAGCLCPVGDLFNYAAPDEEICSEDLESMPVALHSNLSSSLKCENSTEKLDVGQPEGYSQRLTDGGYEDDTTSYCFYARKRYRKGEQVLLSYGTYTNLELLEHYGFLLEDNPNDKVFIQLDTDIHRSSSWPSESLYIQPDGSPSFALLCALRLWATPANRRKTIAHLAYSGCLLSVENELFVMKWLKNHCHSILRKLPTTIEEDELLLVSMDKVLDHPSYGKCAELMSSEERLSSFCLENGLHDRGNPDYQLPMKAKRSLERWRLAVLWRISHKKIIVNCISFCSMTISSLSSPYDSDKIMDQI